MGKPQSQSGLINVISYDTNGNISFVSGSTTLMSVSSSKDITTTGKITATTLVVQTITSSISSITGSTKFGSLATNTHQFTGSMFVTGAFYVATGSVGIGTVSPSQLFEVVGGEIKAGRVDSSNEGGQISFGRSTDNATAWYIDAYGNVASPQLRFVNVTNAVVAMTITGSNVGIGTSTPSQSTLGINRIVEIGGASVPGLILRSTNSTAEFCIGSGGDGFLFSAAGGANAATDNIFRFFTGPTNSSFSATERMRITSGGNVGIGNSGYSFVRLNIQAQDTTSSNYAINCDNSSVQTLFFVRNDGLINTGTRTGSPYNNTSGAAANMVVNSQGTLERSNPSSIRFKENVVDWDSNGLETILSLKPKTFTYKEDCYRYPDRQFLGLIAEEVAEVSSFLADFENEDGTGQVENVRYANIVVPLIKAVQELKAEIDELKNNK
jgi:hypothetical protein